MTHLFVLDVATKATRPLTSGAFTVGSFAWSPDGRSIAFDHRINGDPANGGKMDFKGFSEGYAQFFGTSSQPNVVARSTMQVAALVSPGWLVEIEVIAAK